MQKTEAGVYNKGIYLVLLGLFEHRDNLCIELIGQTPVQGEQQAESVVYDERTYLAFLGLFKHSDNLRVEKLMSLLLIHSRLCRLQLSFFESTLYVFGTGSFL